MYVQGKKRRRGVKKGSLGGKRVNRTKDRQVLNARIVERVYVRSAFLSGMVAELEGRGSKKVESPFDREYSTDERVLLSR